MAKLVLTDIANIFGNPTSAETNINANSTAIENAMENTLSRNGLAPNNMNTRLDMNSNPIINLPAATLPTEPVRLGDLDAFVTAAVSSVSGTVGFTDTVATFQITSFAATITHVYTGGYATVGDGGHALYKKVGAEPSHAGKVQSTGGTWWELVFDSWVNVKWFGAKGNGSTDDTASIQSAIEALVAVNGGTIVFPRGTFVCTGTLDLADHRSIILQGMGGRSGGTAPASTLYYTGAGTRFLDFRGTAGCWVKDMRITYSNASFVGNLIDFNHGPALSDSAYGGLEGCLLIPDVVGGDAILVDLNKAIITTIRSCTLSGGKPCISGQFTGGGTYSNHILIEDCTFIGNDGYAVTGCGSNWLFNHCVWETSASGLVQAVSTNASAQCTSLTFVDCRTDDTTVAGGTAFSFSNVKGLTFSGGNLSGEITNSVGIFMTNCSGVSITGVSFRFFTNAINVSTGCDAVSISGNYMNATTTPIIVNSDIGFNHYIENNQGFDGGASPVNATFRKAYTVATLPTANSFNTGKELYCSNVRVSGEGAGAGTGGMVTSNGSVWRVSGTNVTAAA